MKPLKDYSFIRGVCHNPTLGLTKKELEERLDRELGYCRKLNLNSIRFWLVPEEYDKNPRGYLDIIESFIKKCNEFDITVMPILWNGNFITDFEDPSEEWYEKAAIYAGDVIGRFKDEPNILMWDVINEPMCNDYMNHSPAEEYDERFEKIKKYIRRLFTIVKELDRENCLTVGHEQVRHCLSTDDLVDVICYHDYLGTRREIEGAIFDAERLRDKWNKPILNTETGCVGRANPYEIELELAQKHRVGWYVFNLISEGFWGDIHGLVYPDGTIRDPAVIAALFGFFRNREGGRIPVNANKEGHADRAVKRVVDVLRVEPTTLFMSRDKTTEEILEAAEYCVNILEGAEMVPMWNPPSARIEAFRRIPEEKRDVYEIREFAYSMAKLLKEKCHIL